MLNLLTFCVVLNDEIGEMHRTKHRLCCYDVSENIEGGDGGGESGMRKIPRISTKSLTDNKNDADVGTRRVGTREKRRLHERSLVNKCNLLVQIQCTRM